MDHQKKTPLQDLPKIDFTTFVLSISSAAYMGLGVQGAKPDKELARQNIDLLELLAAKTKGNLTPDEAKLLQEILYELRMKFVEVMKT